MSNEWVCTTIPGYSGDRQRKERRTREMQLSQHLKYQCHETCAKLKICLNIWILNCHPCYLRIEASARTARSRCENGRRPMIFSVSSIYSVCNDNILCEERTLSCIVVWSYRRFCKCCLREWILSIRWGIKFLSTSDAKTYVKKTATNGRKTSEPKRRLTHYNSNQMPPIRHVRLDRVRDVNISGDRATIIRFLDPMSTPPCTAMEQKLRIFPVKVPYTLS